MAVQKGEGVLNCPEERFLRIDGGNGGSFFFPAGTKADWKRGLEFYRAVSSSAKVKKTLLALAFPVLKRKARLTAAQVAQAISSELGLKEPPQFDWHASAMISPTRDKALIHHHGRSFEKFASGGSLSGVKRELALYRFLAQKAPESFAFSRLLGFAEEETFVRFEMAYAPGVFYDAPPALASLVPPLAEFFALPDPSSRPWAEMWDALAPEVELPEGFRDGETPVGLVHRDFKPWNVKSGENPLFFDFESADMAGCPLEDLFNYYVEPRLASFPAGRLAEAVRKEVFPLAEKLLRLLDLPAGEVNRYWTWYVLERVAFWRAQGQKEHAARFGALYGYSG